MENTEQLFRALPDADARRELFETYRSLASHLASRYRRRGIESQDLQQIAFIGLLNAIDRFDPDYGYKFTSFAIPTVVGEIKRHFRDCGWATSVPRRLKDISVASRRANESLSQRLGRSPTVDELAEELGADPDDVADAAALGSAYRPEALDAPFGDHGATLMATLGAHDERMELIEDLDSLGPLLESRSDRELEILRLRFYENLTQREIAERIGISQMHVSRILSSTLESLRALMDASLEQSPHRLLETDAGVLPG